MIVEQLLSSLAVLARAAAADSATASTDGSTSRDNPPDAAVGIGAGVEGWAAAATARGGAVGMRKCNIHWGL